MYFSTGEGLSVIKPEYNTLGRYVKEVNPIGSSASWEALASLGTARMAPASGVISGKIYVAGGTDDYDDQATLEVYDPVADTWEAKASMSTARVNPGSGVINGKLYVAGGRSAGWGALATLEVYDPVANSWETKASMPTARIGPAAGVIDGKFYVAGGADDSAGDALATLEVYDPVANSWETKASMSVPRVSAAGAVINGKLYVVGGRSADWYALATLEVYDPVANSWETKASMPSARIGPTAIAYSDTQFSVLGGKGGDIWDEVSTIYIYDSVTDAWREPAALPLALHHAAAQIVDNELYVIGGNNVDGDSSDLVYKLLPSLSDSYLKEFYSAISWEATTPEGTSVEMFYSLDDGDTYVSMGTTPTTYYLPFGSQFYLINYKALLTTNDTSITPSVDSVTTYYATEGDGLYQYTSGTYTSPILDTGVLGANWQTLSWDTTVPDNTSLSFKVRSGTTADLSSAPSFADLNQTIVSGSTKITHLDGISNGQRYFQYQAAFGSSDSNVTPTIHSTNLTYEPVPVQPGAPPSQDAPLPPDLPDSPSLEVEPDQTPAPPGSSQDNPEGDFDFLINGGAEYTKDQEVKLKLFAGSDTKYILISEDPDFSDAIQEKYGPDKAWTLSAGDGEKTVYLKFLTLYDVASQVISKKIIFDGSPPASPVISSPKNYQDLPDNRPTIIGTAEPNSEIILKLRTNNDPPTYYSTSTDQNGNWYYVFLTALADQDYILEATSQDQVGNLSLATILNFKVQSQGISLEPKVPPVIPPTEEETPEPSLPSEEEQEPRPPFIPEEQISLPPPDLTPNQMIFKSLYGNITLEPSSPEEPLHLSSGQTFKSFIKPKKPVKTIKVTIVFQESAGKDANLETQTGAKAPTWNIVEYTLTDQDNDGIYEGEITLPETIGTYLIRTTLSYQDGTIDNLETETLIDPKGYIYTPTENNQQTRINKAEVSLYVLNQETNQFELWPGVKYNQENPQETDKTGEYMFLVPQGKYYLEVKAQGYQSYKSAEFEAREGDVIDQNVELLPKEEEGNNLFTIISIILALILVIGLSFGIYRRKKKQE